MKAIKVSNKHQRFNYHNNALLTNDQLLQMSKGMALPNDKQLDKGKHDQTKLNRRRLTPIIKTVLLCGQQDIALRAKSFLLKN